MFFPRCVKGTHKGCAPVTYCHRKAVIGLVALILIYALLIAPVTVRLDVALGPGAEAVIAPSIWGLGGEWRFRFADHRLIRLDRRGRAHPLRLGGSGGPRPPLPAIRRALRLLELRRLDVALSVSLGDAARTALLSGALGSLWSALPCPWRRRARLRVRPDFLGGQGGVRARCMVFARLGTLLFAALMLFFCTRRSPSWNIPSAN